LKHIVLASKSPRRKELLERLNLDFEIVVSQVDEDSYKKNTPQEYVEKLAYEKAKSVLQLVNKDSIIIGSDTVVVYNNNILGKPRNEKQAYEYIKKLSGNKHLVYSGLCIIDNKANNHIICHEVTEVYMKDLNDYEINSYIRTGEPLDKAGAYGIQGIGAIFVEKIVGDYYNVMGLPLNKLYKGLNEIGVNYFKIKK
jgi:septum formation protein